MWILNKNGIYTFDKDTKNYKNIMSGAFKVPDDVMYVIPDTSKEDKPVKLCFESNIKESKVEIYKLILKEVLSEILKYNYDLRIKLTRQQIHSERGKIKHGNYKEVVNFLVKRGITKDYINTELNIERERIVYTVPLSDIIGTATNAKFGIINIK